MTTVWRYVTELVDLLAAAAPRLGDAVQSATRKAYVVVDGTLISIDWVGMRAKADRPYCSGKHKRHGLNVQVLTDPAGRLIWASPALPGSVHDVKAARRHGLVHALTGYDVPVLADRGYQGAAGTIRVPFRGRDLPTGPTAVNTSHARLRAPGERGPATLKTWRLLRHFGAWAPGFPGCIALGDTVEETEREMREAIAFHLDGLRADGPPVPTPTTVSATVPVVAA